MSTLRGAAKAAHQRKLARLAFESELDTARFHIRRRDPLAVAATVSALQRAARHQEMMSRW